MPQSHIGLGILYGKQGKFKLALDSLNQGLVIAEEIKDQRLIRDGYQKLSESFLIQEDYKAALKHFRSYAQTKDQIFNKESSNRIADLQARYETAKKQEKIELLQRDQRISNLQIGRQKTLNLFLVVTLALILIIEDNGIGIAEDKIKLLFTLEQNIATTGTDGEKGSGLGLYLCKDFIEKNGGKISMTSKLGQGSRFQFSLPICPLFFGRLVLF